MKKYLIFCLLCMCQSLSAQSFWKQAEIEVGPTVIVAAAKQGGRFHGSWNVFADVRYNFVRLPFDVGLHFGLGTIYRDWNNHYLDRNNHFKNLLAVGNYNFRRYRNVSPFVGAGVGWSHWKIDVWGPRAGHVEYDNRFCFMPRVGVELFRVVRLSVNYKIMGRDYNNLECALGVVIGGWKRR